MILHKQQINIFIELIIIGIKPIKKEQIKPLRSSFKTISVAEKISSLKNNINTETIITVIIEQPLCLITSVYEFLKTKGIIML